MGQKLSLVIDSNFGHIDYRFRDSLLTFIIRK